MVFGPGASQGGLGCSGGHFGRVWRGFGRVPGASQAGLGCSGEQSGAVLRSFGGACVAGGSRSAADDTRSGPPTQHGGPSLYSQTPDQPQSGRYVIILYMQTFYSFLLQIT